MLILHTGNTSIIIRMSLLLWLLLLLRGIMTFYIDVIINMG